MESSAVNLVADVAGMQRLSSQVNQVICGGRAGALGILPEELWLKLFEKYLHSAEDIRNVLSAFPELDKLFHRKKASWLLPLVLPHLMTKHLVAEVCQPGIPWPWIRSEELFKLRLVSKRWKKAVEMSLENHAARNPLSPRDNNDEVESSSVAIPENHFSYHRIRNYPLGASKFDQTEDIDKFLLEMGDFQENPFPGKSILLQIYHDTNFRQVVARTVVLLEKFGQHVLDFQIDYWANEEEYVGDLDLCRNILKCLTLVPNLKSLIFTGDFSGARDFGRDNFFEDPESQNLFPELRNLERFEWRVEFNGESIWTTRMLETYGRTEGLRKLGIPLALLSTMDLALFQSVHLTELHIFLDVEFDPNVERIAMVVRALPNHQDIRKFGLSAIHSGFPTQQPFRINELIRMLAEFNFESVVFQDLELVEGNIPEHLPLAITVSSLDLEDTRRLRLHFNFLRFLPNLKFLSVKIENRRRLQMLKKYWKMERDGGVVDLEVGSFGKRLTKYYMKAYDPTLEIPENAGIWNEVPSLEMLSLSMAVMMGEEGKEKYLGVRFVRECGNRAFLGPRPDEVKWDEEEVGMVDGMFEIEWDWD